MRKSNMLLVGAVAIALCMVAGPVFGTGTEEAPAAPAAPMMEAEEFGPVEISFWHALSGANGKAVLALVDRFNMESEDVTVVAEYAGGYADALNKLVLSVQSGETPNIVMTYDDGQRRGSSASGSAG